MRLKNKSFLGLLFACVTTPVFSTDLLEGYKLALENDRSFRSARAKLRADSESAPQALSQLLPNISATFLRNQNEQTRRDGTLTRVFPRYPSESDAITLRQPIFRLRSVFALQQARAQARGFEADLQKEKQTLGFRFASAYFEALFSHEKIELISAQKRNAENQLLAAQRSYQLGTGLSTDVEESRAQLLKVQAQEVGLKNSLTVTLTQLETIIGRKPNFLMRIDGNRLDPETFDPGELQSILDLLLLKSPDIVSRAAQLEAAKISVRTARSEHLPTLDAVIQYSSSVSDNPFFPTSQIETKSAGLQLTIPIFSGGSVDSRVRENIARSEESRERYLNSISDAKIQLLKEYGSLKQGISETKAAEQSLFSAEQLLASVTKGNALGTRTKLDVLSVEQRRAQALIDRSNARYQMLIAWIRLNALIGTLDEFEFERINMLLSTEEKFVILNN